MLFKKILVAYDGSDLSKKALAQAMKLAKTDPETELEIVHVMEIPVNYNLRMPIFGEVEEAVRKESQALLDDVEGTLKEIPNKSDVILLRGGSPSYEILNCIKNGDYDLIVIGSRGLSGVSEFLGSVSHTVVQKSPVPVLVFKE